MASGVYNRGKLILTNGTHTWGSSGVTVRLVTGSYTPDADHNTNSDLTNELSGGNYAALTALGNQSISEDDVNDRVDYLADKAVYASLALAAGQPRYAIIEDTTTGGLIAWIDIGAGAAAPDGNNYEIRWNSVDGNGAVFRLT